MRNKKGQFQKGYTYRKSKPYWNKEWLEVEYIVNFRSALNIAKQFNTTENNIFYWLHKHNIPCRTIKEIRKRKYWGASGEDNPMYMRREELNPNWQGGKAPYRQFKYSRFEWKELNKKILERDNYQCQLCDIEHIQGNKLIIHHWFPVSSFPEFIDKEWNLITICNKCHKKIHSVKIFKIENEMEFRQLISEGKIK